MAAVLELWDAKTARDAMTKVADGHRGINKIVAYQLSTVLAEGRWQPDGKKPITFLADGTLIDGYTRASVIASLPKGQTVAVWVERDLPVSDKCEESLYLAKRTWGHALAYTWPSEGSSRMNVAASITNMVHAYDGPSTLPDFSKKIWMYPEMLDFVSSWDASLIWAARNAQRIQRQEDKLPGTVSTVETLGFVLWLLQDEKTAPQFFMELARREPSLLANKNDPRTQMHDHYVRSAYDLGKLLKRDTFAVRTRRIAEMLRCWDAHVTGTAWTPWDGSAAEFKHPAASWNARLGW